MGGKFLLKLNIGGRPIANKYREGKMKRTLKRELKVREIVKRETFETSIRFVSNQFSVGEVQLAFSVPFGCSSVGVPTLWECTWAWSGSTWVLVLSRKPGGR